MYLSLLISRSSSVLQSTAWHILSHLVSISASYPLKIGDPAVKAKNKGAIIAN